MDIVKGRIVKAKAGRDKDKFFVVVDIYKSTAYICDGKTRRIEKPKRKNVLHLAPTAEMADEFNSNRKIREILKNYRGD
ncbi:MAG: KOW domain-containing RNA-binding protein [Anaeromassilibacillus sp.]|nr:KOW domain-containing RNA-binding protein [Anaeromassilibacillus sp.]MDY3779370.1 KOW domain-containing RNA-binding protein [Candidatus Limousia pullorum]